MNERIGLANELLIRSPLRLLPVIGYIKTGIRQAMHGRKIPKRLDHFVICTRFKDETGEYVIDRKLMEEIARRTNQNPDKLQKIPITLAFDDISLNFQSWFIARYEGKRCVGDGKKARLILPDGQIKMIKCPCDRLRPDYEGKAGRCSVYSRLFAIIRHSSRIGGVYLYRTKSWNSSKNLICMLHFFKKNTGGVLAGLPLNLIIYPERVITPEGKTRLVYVVSLEYEGRTDNVLKELAEYGYYVRSLKRNVEDNETLIKMSLPHEKQNLMTTSETETAASDEEYEQVNDAEQMIEKIEEDFIEDTEEVTTVKSTENKAKKWETFLDDEFLEDDLDDIDEEELLLEGEYIRNEHVKKENAKTKKQFKRSKRKKEKLTDFSEEF